MGKGLLARCAGEETRRRRGGGDSSPAPPSSLCRAGRQRRQSRHLVIGRGLLYLEHEGVQVLDVVQVAEDKRLLHVEAERDDVLGVLVRQSKDRAGQGRVR